MNRMLIFNQNISGMNPFLFEQLGMEWTLFPEDVPGPWLLSLARRLLKVPHPTTWDSRLHELVRIYGTSARCFTLRSNYAGRIRRKFAGDFDLALQIGGTFDALSAIEDRPTAVFASFNTLLAYREWRPWAPFPDEKAFRKRYELERQLYLRADCILCTNDYVRRSFINDYGVPEEKLAYIGYGANLDPLPAEEKSYNQPLALFVGYDFARKGGPDMVEAFRKVHNVRPEARLRIIGPADLDPHYLGDGIEYLGMVTERAEIRRHLTEASFFVMPSICEPFGLAFLEAMAFGNACIGTRNNAMPEIIEDATTGYLVTAGDVDALAERMMKMFDDRTLRQRMGMTAAQRVGDRFSWELCGKRARKALGRLTTKA